jgi:rsbT co-antagonist protein RsbR
MSADTHSSWLADTIEKHHGDLLSEWLREQRALGDRHTSTIPEDEVRDQSRRLLTAIRAGLLLGSPDDLSGPAWAEARDVLGEMSRERASRGSSPSNTARFVFSLKQPLFARIRRELGQDAGRLAEETWTASLLIDSLGLHTTEAFQKNREEIIARQQQELLELSTPVVELWEGILALPLIGTLDSARTQVVMESLLQRIVETGAPLAIIDITGVPTVDTLVAQHLLKTVAAARLMGADCIISGIRPQIAQTIVHLGVDLGDVITKSTLAAALAVALQRSGLTVARATPAG